MLYLFIAFLVSVISSIPLILARKHASAVTLIVVCTLFGWLIGYSSAAGFAGPMFGWALFFTAACSTVAFVITISFEENERVSFTSVLALPLSAWFAFFGIAFYGSEMLNAPQYRALVGDMEKRVWTQDVQPKDPAHVRLVSHENAVYLARKVVGELGTVGSQFAVNEDALTLQAIRGELWYVIPLDFADFRAWLNTGTSVGYIMIHAEDPNHQPIVKQLPKEKQFVYTPGAWFGNDLIRHLRLDGGNLRVDLRGTHLEIDDDGNPSWVTTVLEPSIGQFGDKVKGVLITDPVTGASQFAPLGEVPAWVDRVIPRDLTKNYIDYWGEYVDGWVNSWWGKRDLTEAEEPSLIYGSAHDPNYVTGVTSQNTKDDSLVGIVYTHTRTGKSIYYEIKGGATDEAVGKAVAKFQDVQFKHLHPGSPQLYNLYGTMASIVPLVNENHAYSGVAIANINNVQQIAMGRSLSEAVRQYQRLLGANGDLAHLEKEKKLSVVEGVIARAKQDLAQNGSVYYVVIEGAKQAFVGGSGEFQLLPLAQAGDRVKIEFYASGESVVPMHSFVNLSLPIERSKAEATVDDRKEGSRDANEAKPVRRDVGEILKNATPEQLRKVEESLKK